MKHREKKCIRACPNFRTFVTISKQLYSIYSSAFKSQPKERAVSLHSLFKRIDDSLLAIRHKSSNNNSEEKRRCTEFSVPFYFHWHFVFMRPLLLCGINLIENLCGPMCQPFPFFLIVSIKFFLCAWHTYNHFCLLNDRFRTRIENVVYVRPLQTRDLLFTNCFFSIIRSSFSSCLFNNSKYLIQFGIWINQSKPNG